jgi:hypothetical protein
MSIQTASFAEVIEPTTASQREALRAAGFIHVTGLRYCSIKNGNFAGMYVPLPGPTDLGKYDSNNGTDVIVTLGGEIWVACHTNQSHGTLAQQIKIALAMLCPRGRGTRVPGSNGESFFGRDLSKRHADPSWEPNYNN